jgi:hypothetical protein
MDAMQVSQAANDFMTIAATFPGDTMPHITPVRPRSSRLPRRCGISPPSQFSPSSASRSADDD